MKVKLFSLFMVAALAVGFVSCGDDDDDGPVWDKNDLKGSYSGTEKIYLPSNVMEPGDTVKNNTTVAFNSSSDANALAVSIPSLLGDIKATNFGFSNHVYSFKLGDVKSITYNSTDQNGIPPYLVNWFGKYYSFITIDKVVISLKSQNGGKYDKASNVMAFRYDGEAIYTFKNIENATKTQSVAIRYDYPVLKK